MSRDFTPHERYLANKNTGIWLQNLEIANMSTGEKRKMYTEEEQAIRLRFPNLAVAMCDTFLALYMHCPDETRDEQIRKLEELQTRMQKAADEGRQAFAQCEVPETMKQWFLGKLTGQGDTHFYYAEENDKAYLKWCENWLESGMKEYPALPEMN